MATGPHDKPPQPGTATRERRREKCHRLKRFPYQQDTEQLYTITRSAQLAKMWSRVRNPCRACSQGRSVMVTVLCWSGLLFTFGALMISFYKDSHDENEQSFEVVFDLSVVELVLTLIAVFITLAKQTTLARQVDDTRTDLERHDDSTPVMSSRQDVSVLMPGDDLDGDDEDGRWLCSFWNARSVTSKFIIVVMIAWLTSSIVLIGSFVGFYIADRHSHSYLQHMKYTTSFVLFLSIICDAIITEIFHEALAHSKLDVCRLVALQLKSELYYELNEKGRTDRIEKIEQYLDATKQFAPHKLDHIVLCDQFFVFSKDRQAVDTISRPKFENVTIQRSPATELRMNKLMNQAKSNNGQTDVPISLSVVKTANDTEECMVMETKAICEEEDQLTI